MFFLFAELSINIYRSNGNSSTPPSMYRTPTDEFDSLMLTRNSFSSYVSAPTSHKDRNISIQVKQLEMGIIQRTYDMKVSMKWVQTISIFAQKIWKLIMLPFEDWAPF